MNVSDAEIAWSILKENGFTQAKDIKEVHFSATELSSQYF